MEAKTGNLMTPEISEKEKRSELHKFIKAHYGDVLDSTTNKRNEICISYGPPKNRHQSPPKKFCLFHLYKENKDTMEAINILSKLSK